MDNSVQDLLSNIKVLYDMKENIGALLELLGNDVKTIKPKGIDHNKIPPGIKNFGNTCFHNSAIQLLYRVEELRDFVIDDNIAKQYTNKNILQIINLLREMNGRANNFNIVKDMPIGNRDVIKNFTCPIMPALESFNVKLPNVIIQIKNIMDEYFKNIKQQQVNKVNIGRSGNIMFKYENDKLNEIDRLFTEIIELIQENKDETNTVTKLINTINYLDNNIKPNVLYMLSLFVNTLNTLSFAQQDPNDFLNAIFLKLFIDCSAGRNEWNFVLEKNNLCDYENKQKYNFKQTDPRSFLNINVSETLHQTTEKLDNINNINQINNLKLLYENKIEHNTQHSIENALYINIKKNDGRMITDIISDNYNFNIDEIMNKIKNKIIPQQVVTLNGKLYFKETKITPGNYVIILLNVFILDLYNNSEKIFHNIKLEGSDGYISFPNSNVKYELIGFIVHIGLSKNTGHYVTYIKYGKKWYLYDDNKVTKFKSLSLMWNTIYVSSDLQNKLNISRTKQIELNNELDELLANIQSYDQHKNKIIEKLQNEKLTKEETDILVSSIHSLNDKINETVPKEILQHKNLFNLIREIYNLEVNINYIKSKTPYMLLYRKKSDTTFEYLDPTNIKNLMNCLIENI